MIKNLRFTVIPVVGLLVGACGGSSDGGPLPVDYAAISADNAEDVASAVLGASLESAPIGDYAQLLTLSGSISTPSPSGADADAGAVFGKASNLLGKSRDSQLYSPVPPTTSPCSVAGTVTLSGDIASTQTLTPGDTISFEFAECDDGIIVVSGLFELTIAAFAGDFESGYVTIEVEVALTDFRVTENGEASASVDGSVSFDLDLTAFPSITLVASGTGLDFSDGATTFTLDNYSLTETSDGFSGAYTRTLSGRVWSSEFLGAVDFETTVALESFDEGNAYIGRIEITGDHGSKIAVVVIDSTALRLEVDEDGDGVVDVSIDTTWDALL